MDKRSGTLHVFFEDPFWVGVFERIADNKLSACKVTFGSEPKDVEVQEYILHNYYKLRFSPSIHSEVKVKEHVNPKRLVREARKQIENVGIGTKSQQALKLQQELGKIERKTKSREKRDAERKFQFELKQQKKKGKHKGR